MSDDRGRDHLTISGSLTLSGFGDEIDPDPAVQGAVLSALGARHIEVRSAWGTSIVGLSDEQLTRLRSTLSSAGLSVSAIASPVGKVDVSRDPDEEVIRLRRAIKATDALDARFIRVFSFFRSPERAARDIRDDVFVRMELLAVEAEKAGVVLVHENEKHIFGDVPERILDMVESVGSPALRLAWDSANFVQVGVRPFTEGYELLRPYIEYLQVKDALAATGEVVLPGRGDGQILETIAALRTDGFNGFASLEPHLAQAHALGGFSGPRLFGAAARAFQHLAADAGVELA